MDISATIIGFALNAVVSAPNRLRSQNPSVHSYFNKKEAIYEFKEKRITCASSIIKE